MFYIDALKKMLFILLAVFVLSCSEDSGNPLDDNNNDDDNNLGSITASELKISGKLKIRDIGENGWEIKDWNKGTAKINLYIGVNLSDYNIGTESTVSPDGSFEFTLPATMDKQYMFDLSYSYNSDEFSPDHLMVSLVPIQAYVTYMKDGAEVENYIDVAKFADLNNLEKSFNYNFHFYSEDGYVKYNEGDGTYMDINCKKGWNIIENDMQNLTKIDINQLPNDVIFFSY